jgi:dienelactone hydrolase
LGKTELFEGRDALRHAYGAELTKRGYAVLSIDAWCFGERQGRTESAVFKELLWRGKVLWGMMVFDTLKAFDYLAAREDVQADSIVSMGISMGGTMALWSTALEPRIRACIDLCSLAEYESLINQQNLDRHGIYYYVPALLKHFSAEELNHLTLPRPRLCVVGRHDGLTPIEGVQSLDQTMRSQADAAGQPESWQLLITETGHFETEYSHQQVLSFLSELQQT